MPILPPEGSAINSRPATVAFKAVSISKVNAAIFTKRFMVVEAIFIAAVGAGVNAYCYCYCCIGPRLFAMRQ